MTVLRVIPKGDLALANGTTYRLTGAACAAQRISISLDIFLGEWFLDLRIGIAYFRDILIHSPNAEVVRSVFKKGVLQTPGIVACTSPDVVLDTTKRIASVSFVATYQDGTTVPQTLDVSI